MFNYQTYEYEYYLNELALQNSYYSLSISRQFNKSNYTGYSLELKEYLNILNLFTIYINSALVYELSINKVITNNNLAVFILFSHSYIL